MGKVRAHTFFLPSEGPLERYNCLCYLDVLWGHLSGDVVLGGGWMVSVDSIVQILMLSTGVTNRVPVDDAVTVTGETASQTWS